MDSMGQGGGGPDFRLQEITDPKRYLPGIASRLRNVFNYRQLRYGVIDKKIKGKR